MSKNIMGVLLSVVTVCGILLLFQNCQPIEEYELIESGGTPGNPGVAFFNTTLKPQLNVNCAGCHGGASNMTRNFFLPFLGNPFPAIGGTNSATNNQLINYAKGDDPHPQDLCQTSVNVGICLDFQEWWNIENGN